MGTLLTLFAVGLVTLIVVGVVLAVLGVVFSLTLGLAMFLLTKVAPVILVGWLVLKLVERSRVRRALSAADERWLEDR